MPLLARMVASPLVVDIRKGAIRGLAALLAEGRISPHGRVAVAVGPGQGQQIAELLRPTLADADMFPVAAGTVDGARELAMALRTSSYDAIVGIGGGRTLDVAKYAASLVGLPMVSVATNLSHDGIGSPVASLEHEGRKGSFGVHIPIAVFVDLDFVQHAPPHLVRAGIGDALSNLNAIADWQLAADVRNEPIDGLSAAFARSAAESLLYRDDGIESADFLTTLAEALVLSGLAMATAGNSRPCSGSCHEVLHAIDHLYPGTSNHGELAGLGATFCSWLREDPRTDEVAGCLRRHHLPVAPADIGLTNEQFAEAVAFAPSTRPDRYTVLEHLDLSRDEVGKRVDEYARLFDR